MITISLFYYYEKVFILTNMGDWETFIETSLPEKESFHSHLNMEDINDTDYVHEEKGMCRKRY